MFPLFQGTVLRISVFYMPVFLHDTTPISVQLQIDVVLYSPPVKMVYQKWHTILDNFVRDVLGLTKPVNRFQFTTFRLVKNNCLFINLFAKLNLMLN